MIYVYIRLVRLGKFKNKFEHNILFSFKFAQNYIHFSITIIITKHRLILNYIMTKRIEIKSKNWVSMKEN